MLKKSRMFNLKDKANLKLGAEQAKVGDLSDKKPKTQDKSKTKKRK